MSLEYLVRLLTALKPLIRNDIETIGKEPSIKQPLGRKDSHGNRVSTYCGNVGEEHLAVLRLELVDQESKEHLGKIVKGEVSPPGWENKGGLLQYGDYLLSVPENGPATMSYTQRKGFTTAAYAGKIDEIFDLFVALFEHGQEYAPMAELVSDGEGQESEEPPPYGKPETAGPQKVTYESPEKLIEAVRAGKQIYKTQVNLHLDGKPATLLINSLGGGEVRLRIQAREVLNLPDEYSHEGFKVNYSKAGTTVRMRRKLSDKESPPTEELIKGIADIVAFVRRYK